MRYRRGRLDPAEILNTIAELGFEPRVGDGPAAAAPRRNDGETRCSPWPEPLAGALERARAVGKPLFLDFFAEWCAPCHTLEEEILPHPDVAAALERFHFLRVDTDRSAPVVRCLHVFGLPTIVVLKNDGAEIFRQEGLLPAEELAAELRRLAD